MCIDICLRILVGVYIYIYIVECHDILMSVYRLTICICTNHYAYTPPPTYPCMCTPMCACAPQYIYAHQCVQALPNTHIRFTNVYIQPAPSICIGIPQYIQTRHNMPTHHPICICEDQYAYAPPIYTCVSQYEYTPLNMHRHTISGSATQYAHVHISI